MIVYGYQIVNKVMGQVQQTCPACQRQAVGGYGGCPYSCRHGGTT